MDSEPISSEAQTGESIDSAFQDEFDRLKAELAEKCEVVHMALKQGMLDASAFEQVALAIAAGTFSKAFLETLGQNAANGVSQLVTRFRGNGEDGEAHIGVGHGTAATVVVTKNLPDEARLALLALDVTAKEISGKRLRWDSKTGVWLPEGD